MSVFLDTDTPFCRCGDPGQYLQQGGFPYIGFSRDGNGYSMPYNITHLKRIYQGDKSCMDFSNQACQFFPVCKLNIFFAEVKFQFNQS